MHYHEIYLWLEDNNLWKATVGWGVGIITGFLSLVFPWSKHRKAQEAILKELRKKS